MEQKKHLKKIVIALLMVGALVGFGYGDGLPMMGPSPSLQGLMLATGHSREGILLAPVTAALLADLILRDTCAPALERFFPRRFGTERASGGLPT